MVGLTLAAAGCGSDGRTAARKGHSPYAAQGDAACRRAQREVQLLRPAATPRQMLANLDASQRILDQLIQDLQKLHPPRRYTYAWLRFVGDVKLMRRTNAAMRRAVQRRDVGAIRRLQADLDAPTTAADAISAGLVTCAAPAKPHHS